jgi:DNA invertase Pin-like site-specific DNA recombinase
MLGYFIYCRKSSEAEDRQVLSIESQTRELEQLAAKMNLPVAEILMEAKSAKDPGRQVFNEMMQRLSRGEAAGIICWKLDRLARNPVDGGSIIWAIKQQGIKVLTPAQSYAREDDNIILMYIEFGMAQKYVDDLSKNVRRGLKTKVQNGWYPGVAPPGYLNNTVKLTGENNLIKDPERFPLIRRMWDMMLTGIYTPPHILELATKEWGLRTRPMPRKGSKPFVRSAIYEIFTRPFYYGSFEYPKGSNQWYQGKHEAMITEAEYDRVQTLLGRNGNPRPRVRGIFPFTGLIRCGECDGMVTAEEKHQLICGICRFKFAYRQAKACPRCRTPIERMASSRFVNYVYYHCAKSKNPRCSQKCISGPKLEAQIDQYLSRIQISERFRTWAIQYLHELTDNERASQKEISDSQQRAYQECLRRIDNLVKLKTSPSNSDGSLLSDEEYGRERLQLLKEKVSLEELLQDDVRQAGKSLDLSAQTFEFASAARERFANGSQQTQKEILAAVGSNFCLKDKNLRIQAKEPFFLLEKSLCQNREENDTFELEKTGLPQARNRPRGSTCPQMWGQRDEDRTFGPKEKKLVKEIYRFFRNLPRTDLEFWLLRQN